MRLSLHTNATNNVERDCYYVGKYIYADINVNLPGNLKIPGTFTKPLVDLTSTLYSQCAAGLLLINLSLLNK